jgi:hypothetical protein
MKRSLILLGLSILTLLGVMVGHGLFAIGRRSPSGCPAAGPRKKCIWGLRHRM